ncbi:dTDP-4-dehydrorhamnose reductase [Shewanella sp. Scap07]|uniref:dTDP-4-dehydrorhamnose reductase n=1 Tax=Shewanella sp. Scap07 TaxID=2589987 RepID=UPI0015BF7ADE|nr:dTDP-4-dehydrorhamnose reductase [Shewanella sp. Scap07]QLE86065.1 dTDP-4-dehydrorhamnose reductase [Shewanella sp. Scap07]
MIKVMVTGKCGMLARELAYTLIGDVESIFLDSNKLDVTDVKQVRTQIKHHQPDIIINCAAYTSVENAEKQAELAYTVNERGASNLAYVCAEQNLFLIHISTDYVFSGEKGKPYYPSDEPKPVNVYGASKLAGEHRVIERMSKNVLIIRTSWLYSEFGNNFVNTMLSRMQKCQSLTVVDDQFGSPTWARGLAEFIWTYIKTISKLSTSEHCSSQIIHWTDLGVTSWYEFALVIQQQALFLGLIHGRVEIRPIDSASSPFKARRPKNSTLGHTKGSTQLLLTQQHWQVQLQQMLSEMKNNRS